MMLYIVRHAWAGSYGDADWVDDVERPLTDKGRSRFAHVAQTLFDRGVAPTLIATSPLVRCRQTAELLAGVTEPASHVVELDTLQPGSDLPALVAWTAEQAKEHEAIAWVGHAPDVGRMTAALVGPSGWIRFAKGTTAAVRFYSVPELGAGELQWLVTAKMLGC